MLKIHVVLEEPVDHKAAVKEVKLHGFDSSQDFSVSTDRLWSLGSDSPVWQEVAVATQTQPMLKYVGMNVRPNSTKLFPDYHVPVMLWPKGTLRLQGTYSSASISNTSASDTNESLFDVSVEYDLDPEMFPQAPVSNKWKKADSPSSASVATLVTSDKCDDIKEPWQWVGSSKLCLCFSQNYDVAALLTIRKALTTDTPPQTLMYYVDRMHALEKLALFFDEKKMPAIAKLKSV